MRAPALVVLGLSLTACPAAGPSPSASTNADSSSDSTTGSDTDTGTDTTTFGPIICDFPSDVVGECEALEQLVDHLDALPNPDLAASAIDAFIIEHDYGEHGFPLVEGSRLCPVYRGQDAGEVSVAGDFNGWDPEANPLVSPVPGFAYAIIDLDGPPTGLYKLVHPGQDFRADPLARRHGWDEFGEYSQIDPLPGRSHHERWRAFAPSNRLEARDVTVWLPADALDGPALGVLYMHDGQNLFTPEALFGGWQVSATLDEAIAAEVVAPVVVVGVANTAARVDEYTPVEDLIDGMVLGGRADDYADFLVEDLLPFIADRYPVSTEASATAVMGSSLGGLVSLHIGLRHRDRFDHVASMSGTVGWGSLGAANPTILDAYQAAPPSGLRVYLDSGGSEGMGCPEGGSDNYCDNLAFADALRGLGWVDELDLFYRWAPDAGHNEAAWAARVLPALVDWFPGPA